MFHGIFHSPDLNHTNFDLVTKYTALYTKLYVEKYKIVSDRTKLGVIRVYPCFPRTFYKEQILSRITTHQAMTIISHERNLLPRLINFFLFLKGNVKFLHVGQKLSGHKQINIKNP